MATLSKENIDKLNLNAIYCCEPMLEKLPSYKRSDPYWCCNWTFKPQLIDGEYYMYDTYWGNGFHILLTDENFDKFEFVFDRDDVEIYRGSNWYDYDEADKWIVRLDSGGGMSPKYVIKKSAVPIKDRVIERLEGEIKVLELNLETKRRNLQLVIDDAVNLKYV